MPIYEYRCQSCDNVSEAFVRSGKEPTQCPECGEEALKRLISKAGIIFKGSGFYVTDSKSSSNSTNSSSTTESNSKTESKSETKSEAKSESTSTSTSTSSAASSD